MRNDRGPQVPCAPRWGASVAGVCFAAGLLGFVSIGRAAQITDDFNDGNDSANPTWTRYDPFSQVGSPPATWGFPGGNTYRIQAPAFASSPAGPPRAASYLNNQNYSTFSLSADILDWNNGINQAFGLLARLNSVGLGATTGYALTYTPTQHTIDITQITHEASSRTVSSAPVTLDPAKDYRFVFTGEGSTLTGAIYDLSDLSTPVVMTGGSDGLYTNGFPGLLVFDNSNTHDVGGDATFDNFVVSDTIAPEPAGAAICGIMAVAGLLRRRRF